MVNLVIMRHGEAEPHFKNDSERQLTAAGQAEVSQMADWLHHHYSAFNRIFSSPYRRTQQTATIVQDALGISGFELNTDLVPEGNAQLVVDFLELVFQQDPDAKIVLVSHMPLVSFLVEAFTRSGQTPIFDTAGIACIDYHQHKGALLEYTCPSLLSLAQTVS